MRRKRLLGPGPEVILTTLQRNRYHAHGPAASGQEGSISVGRVRSSCAKICRAVAVGGCGGGWNDGGDRGDCDGDDWYDCAGRGTLSSHAVVAFASVHRAGLRWTNANFFCWQKRSRRQRSHSSDESSAGS
eukprot:761903-Hanusia_phi.AAC.1